ncbi:MAG: helix-turn-helix transcriptional regulator [Ignavibacteriae bacterium]|nr:helix-turn-helix transcriptional regulator [Ignavibacteriota bacterium]
MTKLNTPVDFELFVQTVDSLEGNQRNEYIFDNLSRVFGGDNNVLWKYAVESKLYWEKRCCSMLEYQTPEEMYSQALLGLLPKAEWREKVAIHRLARALQHYSRYSDITVLTDGPSIAACYQAEALLKHINNKEELLALYIHFTFAMRQQDSQKESLTEINNKALALADEIGAKNEQMQVLSNFGHLREHVLDYAGALPYHHNALDILENVIKENKIEDAPRTIPEEYLLPKCILLFNIAHCSLLIGNIRETITVCHKAAAYAQRLQSDNVVIHIELVLSRAYSILGAYNTALEHLFRAEAITESRNSPFLSGQNKIFIATAYSKMGEYQKAIEYGLQALPIYKLHESPLTYILIGSRVGGFMVSAGEFERAQSLLLGLLETAVSSDISGNLDWYKAQIFRSLAGIAIKREQWETALTYLQIPFELLFTEGNLPQYIIETLVVGADAFIGAKKYERAADFAMRTLKLSSESNDLQNQFIAHKQLAAIAEHQGDFTSAYTHHKEFHRIKEQVFNNESDQRNKNMMILLEQQEAVRSAQAERIRRFELEEEIGQLSNALVHREQALKEIRSTLRSMKTTNEHAEQVVQVLHTVIRSSENTIAANSIKTYKQIDVKIETAFPTLTKIQREVCRYITLGHSTKDIARLMSISAQSVNTQRYRMRARLGLTTLESLDAIIKQTVKDL